MIKGQLNEIEEEKTKISDKIRNLLSSLDQSKFVVNLVKRDNKIEKKILIKKKKLVH